MTDLKKRSTNINEVCRRKLDISRDEYALCQYIHYRCADSRQRIAGWCCDEKEEIAVFIGVTRAGLYKMAARLIVADLIESNGIMPFAWRATPLWIDTENECKQSLHGDVNKVDTRRKQSLHGDVNKVDTHIKVEYELENDLAGRKEKAASPFHLPEKENPTLEAKKEKTPPPSSAPPPPKKDYGNLCPDCHGAGWHLGRNGRETCETCLGNGLNSERLLHPPFTPIGTIEPQPATIVRLYDNELPGATIVDSVPGTYETKRDPRETPPQEFRRVNVPDEITRLKTDELAKETFALVRKIPSNLFSEYVEAFEKEIGGTGETYPNQPAFRKHFFNWSGCRYEQSQRKATIQNGKGGSLTRAGGDLSVYQEKQIF